MLRNVKDKRNKFIKNKSELLGLGNLPPWIRSTHFETKGKIDHEGWFFKQFFPRKTLFPGGKYLSY